MPEDADREPPIRRLDRLDRPVVRVRGHAQPLADATEPLMVVRLDGRTLTEEIRDARPLLGNDVVVAERAGDVLVLRVADDLRKMLDEVAAARDVQHLR